MPLLFYADCDRNMRGLVIVMSIQPASRSRVWSFSELQAGAEGAVAPGNCPREQQVRRRKHSEPKMSSITFADHYFQWWLRHLLFAQLNASTRSRKSSRGSGAISSIFGLTYHHGCSKPPSLQCCYFFEEYLTKNQTVGVRPTCTFGCWWGHSTASAYGRRKPYVRHCYWQVLVYLQFWMPTIMSLSASGTHIRPQRLPDCPTSQNWFFASLYKTPA